MVRPLLFAMTLATLAFSPPGRTRQSAGLVISLHHSCGDKALQLNTSYRNNLNQPFKITRLRYYLGQVCLLGDNENKKASSSYFLVDEALPASRQLLIKNARPGTYSGIEFIVGVDSASNCSGAQSGALDPVHGMFWAWNTGYIFLKLEGSSPLSKNPAQLLEYHIGGYKGPSNCIRKIRLKFNRPLLLRVSGPDTLHMTADIGEILRNIDFSQLSSVTDHRNATRIADNYAQIFSCGQ